MQGPEGIIQRVVRRARRLVPPRSFISVRERCRGIGIEIGGPSAVFRRWNLWPIYPVVGSLDGYNFATRTLWSDAKGHRSSLYARDLVGEASEMSEVADETYDFLLASHVLEHMANPLKALHTWRRVVRPGAIIVLVVPHRDGTFDHRRPVTTLEHIIRDFEHRVTEADRTHIEEILDLHDLNLDPGAGTREAFVARARNNEANRSVHHHVFNTDLVLTLVDRAGLRIEYLDIQLPYHICVACSPGTTTRSGPPATTVQDNREYFPASAAWRRRCLFPSDLDSGEPSRLS